MKEQKFYFGLMQKCAKLQVGCATTKHRFRKKISSQIDLVLTQLFKTDQNLKIGQTLAKWATIILDSGYGKI